MNKVAYGVKETYREQRIKDKGLIFYQNSSLPNVPNTCKLILFPKLAVFFSKSENL